MSILFQKILKNICLPICVKKFKISREKSQILVIKKKTVFAVLCRLFNDCYGNKEAKNAHLP